MASPQVLNTDAQLNGQWIVQSADTVTLTDAQIKALPTTPVQIIAAPGAGKRIKLIAATVIPDTTAGGYTNLNATYAVMALTPTDAASGAWLTTPIVDDATLATPADRLTQILAAARTTVYDWPVPGASSLNAGAASGVPEYFVNENLPLAADVDNAAVYVSIDNNGSGVLTGGNSANTLKLIVYYAVESL